MEEKDKELAPEVNGEAGNDTLEKSQEMAETARQKAMKRARGRNAERNFADDDDEALFSALNEDAAADEEELSNYRRNSEELNNFLRDNPRGASLFNSMRRDGNPIGRFVLDYGKEIVESLDDPEIQKTVVENEAKRLEQLAKDKEFEEQAAQNLEKSKTVRNELIEEGYEPDVIDDAIQKVIDRAVRNLMSDISREDIEDVLNLASRESDIEEARREGEVKGRNANISKEIEKRRRGSDGMPNISSSRNVPPAKNEEKDLGVLGRIASRRPML